MTLQRLRHLWSMLPSNSLFDYLKTTSNPKAMQTMKKRFQEYTSTLQQIERFQMFDARIYLMVFSADWCSDCLEQVPALAKVLTMSENPNIVTKVVNFDDHRDVADELGITAIPTVLVLDKNFRELGRLIEKPSKYSTIEAEIWDITQKGVVRPEPAQPQIFTDHWV